MMTVVRKLTWGSAHYDIQLPGDYLKIRGDYWNQSFVCYRASTNAVVASVHKDYSFADSYAVEISPLENVPLFLACVIVIDHEESRHRS